MAVTCVLICQIVKKLYQSKKENVIALCVPKYGEIGSHALNVCVIGWAGRSLMCIDPMFLGVELGRLKID